MAEHTPHQSHSRVALVTGAARGIGLGIAERLVRDGWQVVLADIDGPECEQAATRLGPAARAMTLDVRDEARLREVIQRTDEWHGGLDALVNNAGISDPHSGPLEKLELAGWQRWLDTNLTGAFLLGKHALPAAAAPPPRGDRQHQLHPRPFRPGGHASSCRGKAGAQRPWAPAWSGSARIFEADYAACRPAFAFGDGRQSVRHRHCC